jgi:hypothetical protein
MTHRWAMLYWTLHNWFMLFGWAISIAMPFGLVLMLS